MSHARQLALLSIVALACASCSAPVQTGLTGVQVDVTYDLELDQLVFSGRSGGADAFTPMARPEATRVLSPEGESVVVVLPDALANAVLVVRVDGLRDGAVVASGAGSATLVAGEIVTIAVHLGQPVACGDGAITELVEECDDGDADAGDGCSERCTVESGWSCSHTGLGPSICESACGDGPV